jgi:hypothetical protein
MIRAITSVPCAKTRKQILIKKKFLSVMAAGVSRGVEKNRKLEGDIS